MGCCVSSSCCRLPAVWFVLFSGLLVASYVTESFAKFFASALPVWEYLRLKVIYTEVMIRLLMVGSLVGQACSRANAFGPL